MTTKAHLGKNSLIDRLTAQVGGNRGLALSILEKRGHVKPGTEELTEEGKARDAMTAGERAVNRASTRSGNSESRYKYNPNTNRATLKRPIKG